MCVITVLALDSLLSRAQALALWREEFWRRWRNIAGNSGQRGAVTGTAQFTRGLWAEGPLSSMKHENEATGAGVTSISFPPGTDPPALGFGLNFGSDSYLGQVPSDLKSHSKLKQESVFEEKWGCEFPAS